MAHLKRSQTRLAAMAGLALLAAACGAADDDDAAMTADQGGTSESVARLAAAPGADAADPGSTQDQAYDTTRQIIFSSELGIEADDVRKSFLAIRQLALANGGFVADSQLVQREEDGEDRSYATITIRVPAQVRETVLDRLRNLDGASVATEQSTAQEVTEEYTDLESRLRNLERSEAQYLDLLEKASSIQDILTVSERVDAVRAEIERIEGRLQVLDDLVELATIAVTLEPTPSIAVAASGTTGFGGAWADAWSAMGELGADLSVAGAWAAVVAICLTPLALAGTGVALISRRRHPGTPVSS